MIFLSRNRHPIVTLVNFQVVRSGTWAMTGFAGFLPYTASGAITASGCNHGQRPTRDQDQQRASKVANASNAPARPARQQDQRVCSVCSVCRFAARQQDQQDQRASNASKTSNATKACYPRLGAMVSDHRPTLPTRYQRATNATNA